MKEFHVWFKRCPEEIITYYTLYEIEQALNSNVPIIHTYQVESVATYLIDLGYHIFIHPFIGDTFELTLGNCSNTDKEIRTCHNLCKMLINNAFDTPTTNVTGLE